MLYVLSRQEFAAVSRQKKAQHDRYASLCWRVVGALTACWMRELGAQKLAIMMFVVNRTLYYRKEAEQIWGTHWQDGVVDGSGNSVCDGLGITEKTFRKHLNELIEQDFLTAWACKDGSNGENVGRLFAINCKKVLQPYTTRGSEMPILNTPKSMKQAQKEAENDVEDDGKIYRGGGVKITPHNNSIKGLTKVNLSARASRSGNVIAGTENVVTTLRIPKKAKRNHEDETPTYVDPEVSAAPRDIVASIQRRSRDVQGARVAAASTVAPWMMSKEQMQALFDKGMQTYFPKLPRVIVTGKEFGFLRKRLRETQPKDFAEFVDWVLRYWTDTASKHRRAIMKGVVNGDSSKFDKEPMPQSPDFATLVYRLPYFLKVHSSYLAERMTRDTEDKADRRVARLERELAQERNTNRILSQRRTQARGPEPRHQGTEEQQPRLTSQDQIDLGPEELPKWQDMGDGGYDLPSRSKRNVR